MQTLQKVIRRSQNNKRRNNPHTEKMVSLLRQILESQRASQIRYIPEQPDVPRIRPKRDPEVMVELTKLNNPITTSTTLSTFGALVFKLSDFPGYSSYTATFDEFKCLQINVKLIPTQNSTNNNAPGSGALLHTVIDNDDASTPTSTDSLLQYSTLKITPPGEIEERTLVPHCAIDTYRNGAFTGFGNIAGPDQWNNAASADIEYYGLKYAISPSYAVETINVYVTAVFKFKSEI